MEAKPSIIGDYHILQTLGSGGMGVVYRARHVQSGEEVALKTVYVNREGKLESIRREIRALARINHPGVVRVIDEGVRDGIPWFAMEFIRGMTMRDYCHRLRFEGEDSAVAPSMKELAKDVSPHYLSVLPIQYVRKLCTLFCQICETLSYLHGEGIIHRDLKPDNIFIKPDETPVLVDFGLIASVQTEFNRESLLVESCGFGTLLYMAPEQIKGGFVDARADLYSLGCMLYELLAGHPPFQSSSLYDIFNAKLNDTARPLHEFISDIPDKVDVLISRLLARSPRDRLGYADAVAAVLFPLSDRAQPLLVGKKSRLYLYRPDFVGREKEVIFLQSRLDEARREHGSVVFITGDSGSGKTRLAVECGRNALNVLVRTISGEFLKTSSRSFEVFQRPIQVIVDCCRERGEAEIHRVFGKNGGLLSSILPVIGTLLDENNSSISTVDLSATEARTRLFDALWSTFEAFVVEGPALLILDNLQWADDLTIGFFEYILRMEMPARSALLILGLCRSDEIPPRLLRIMQHTSVSRLELETLSRDSVEHMVQDMLALTDTPKLLVDYLAERSEGNPYFITEFLHGTIREGLLTRASDGRWKLSDSLLTAMSGARQGDEGRSVLPDSLPELLKRRLEGLPDAVRQVCNIAAVIGQSVSMSLLADIAHISPDELHVMIGELQHRHVLLQTGPVTTAFAHDRIRDVTYAEIPPSERLLLHSHVAAKLEATGRSSRPEWWADLATHWESAGEYERAASYYLKAARWETSLFNYDLSSQHYLAYFRLLSKPTAESIAIRDEFGYSVLQCTGRYEEALLEHEQALAESLILVDQKGELTSLISLGDVQWSLGKISQAMQLYEDALTLARKLDARLQEARVISNMGSLLWEMGLWDQAQENYERALRIAREMKNLRRESIILGNMAILARNRGRPDEAKKLFLEAITQNRQQNDLRRVGINLSNLANLFFSLGQYDEARRHYEEGLSLSRTVGFRWNEATVLSNLGILEHQLKNTNRARELFLDSLAIARELGNERQETLSLSSLANLCGDEGEFEPARNYLEQSLALARKLEDSRLQAVTLTSMATLSRRTDPTPDRALELSTQAETLLRKCEDLPNLLLTLCEKAHCLLALDEEITHVMAELVAILDVLDVVPESESAQAFLRLTRAWEVMKEARHDDVHRGECIEDLPPGFQRMLMEKQQ